MTDSTKHVEIRTYFHVGIGVTVKIDYDGGQISLVEAEKGSMPIKYSGKQWVFTNRGLEYVGGWLDILEAMKNAIKEAEISLKLHTDYVADQKAKLILGAEKAIRKASKKKA